VCIGLSCWDGKALPFDNSGWQQKEPLLGQGAYEQGKFITPSEMRKAKHVVPAEMGVWSKSAGYAETTPSVVSCGCGKKLNMRDARLRLRRCQKCRDANRATLRKPKGSDRWAMISTEASRLR
jgi:hypothetical protein